MSTSLRKFLKTETSRLQQAGLLREELVSPSAQGRTIEVEGRTLLNLTSFDFLGFAADERLKGVAQEAIGTFGLGMGADRFVLSQPVHRELERAIADLVYAEDCLVFPSYYHATSGAFESLFSDRDIIFCDAHVQPGLADGIRLSRAKISPFRHGDLGYLEDRLKRSRGARFRAIVSDSVFALEGVQANLEELSSLAQRYDAALIVDDSFDFGLTGTELKKRYAGLSLVISTLGYAAGCPGGFCAGDAELMAWLRQHSRPYLISEGLAPGSAAAAFKAVQIIRDGDAAMDVLAARTARLRAGLIDAGFEVLEALHPMIVLITKDAVTTQRMTDILFEQNIYVTGFCHPVVPEGAARIRMQVTALHTDKDIDTILESFGVIGKRLGIVGAS